MGEPAPRFVIVVDDRVVGWIDYDRDQREWLTHDEVNMGYGLHPDARGKGYATRAVHLVLQHLGDATDVRVATLLIDADNDTSLAVPARCGFEDHGVLGDHGARFFKRPVPHSTRRYTDGVVMLRPPVPDDRDALIGLRDERFHRFMGDGSPDPRPTFCIVVDDTVVGWVDHDAPGAQTWLADDEVNVGYALHPDHRGNGYASRAVQLLVHHLAHTGVARTATVAIDFDNAGSLAVAQRCGFAEHGTVVGEKESRFFKKPVPPLTYSDGTVTIRRQRLDDAEMNIDTLDDVQIDWLLEPGNREHWESMTPEEQLAHQRRVAQVNHDRFATGPKWSFAIEVDGRYVGHVDADLANPHVPNGEANVSYTMGPAHRGNGYVTRAVRLVMQFVRDHTGAREIHIVVHPDNEPSLRVARAVGAVEIERYVDHHGDTMVRYVVSLR